MKMSKKLTDERIDIIATAFVTNGYIKSKALQAAEYSKSYSEHNGLKLFDNDRVIAAVVAKQAEIQAQTAYNREEAEKHYEQIRVLALITKDLGAANTAIRGKNNLYGLERDKGTGQDVKIYLDMSEKGA